MERAYLIAGLAYGDEGKGATVDFLTRERIKAGDNKIVIVRYNGGPQAAHNVVTPDNRHHTFSQFGAGSFVPGVVTFLSQYMLINPLNMMAEEEHLRVMGVSDIWKRTIIHEDALLVTPYHVAMNRLMEKSRGDEKHGSCGQGVGIARHLHIIHGDKVPFMRDIGSSVLKDKLEFLRRIGAEMVKEIGGGEIDKAESNTFLGGEALSTYLVQQYSRWPARHMVTGSNWFPSACRAWKGSVIFEGAQGMMIDEVHGKAPYQTWTDCTFTNAQKLLDQVDFEGKVVRIGVVRTYYTRHGEGPFVEDEQLKKTFNAQGHKEMHNGTNQYQGAFKIGAFNGADFAYALDKIGGIDALALNHIDAPQATKIIEKLNDTGIVGIVGWGATAEHRSFANSTLF